HSYTFTLEILPSAGSVVQAIEVLRADEAIRVSITPISDWKSIVRDAFSWWLFQFRDPHTGQLVDQSRDFALSCDWGRDAVLDWAMAHLSRIIEPTAVWGVKVETKGFYECAWDDFAFESGDRRLFLHLGVSD